MVQEPNYDSLFHMQNIKDLLNKENKQLVKINALLSLILADSQSRFAVS